MRRTSGDDVYAAIGTNVRFVRQARSLSLEDLAELSGLTPAFLGQVERGERKLSVSALAKIARALRVFPGHLMGGMTKRPASSWESRVAALLEKQPTWRKELVLKMIKCLLRALRK